MIFKKLSFYISLIFVISGVILNYTIKVPNDGIAYLASAEYFLNSGQIVHIVEDRLDHLTKFPTPQIGSILVISFFKFFFKDFWIIPYFFSIIFLVTILIEKSNHFFKNYLLIIKKYYFFFTFLVVANYDFWITASSFYNEAFYYPFLIIFLLNFYKNLIENNIKSFLYNPYVLLFLIFGVIFRVQHILLAASLILFFLFIYRKKNLLIISVLILLINLSIIYGINLFLNENLNYENNSINNHKSFLYISKDFIYQFFIGLKGIKVHFNLYLYFTNLPKIFDINFNNIFINFKETLYFLSCIVFGIFFFICFFTYRKKYKLDFFLIYFVLQILFLQMITDYDTRYFLMSNFIIIFFFSIALDVRYSKYQKFIFSSLSILITLSLLSYSFGYFLNKNPRKNSYKINQVIKKFHFVKGSYYANNHAFVTRYNYILYWITNQSAIRPNYFIENYKKILSERKYVFFIGQESDLYILSKKQDIQIKKFLDNEHYTYIWRLYLNDKK